MISARIAAENGVKSVDGKICYSSRRLPELNLRFESDIKIDNTVSHVIKCGSSWNNIYANCELK